MISIKKISIVSFKRDTALAYGETLKYLFEDKVLVESYSMEDGNFTNMDSDIIVASTYSIYDFVKKQVINCNNIIIADITLTKDSLKKLTCLPKGTKAMVVNLSLEMAVKTIETIYNSGLNHLDLYPVYPGIDNIPNIHLAITPGEYNLVPGFVEKVIDVGDRVLSMKTMLNIGVKLNLSSMTQTSRFKKYILSLAKSDLGFEDLLGQVNILENKLDLILEVFDDGVLVIGNDDKINFINESAKKILNLKSDKSSTEKIEKVFYNFIHEESNNYIGSINDKVILINGQHLVISIYPITNIFNYLGYMVLVRRFTDTEKKQNKIRKQIVSKGHVAKYNFDDIKGESIVIEDAKQRAKMFSMSDSSILIYGKSGTGKELFAQSIHNNSKRKNNPFIAINCASIPENLLESELFGYEPGAFTGAKKEGKIGYFELAHTGTLFLDEIGELDFNLQARLLRVLQEKEVVRIGGDNVVNIDIRIISATNQNLKQLIKENKFREDLYYRINVLRVDLPELKNRKEDIKLLIETFKQNFKTRFEISKEDMNIIENHTWSGNIRELQNFVERLKCLNKSKITRNDIYYCLDADYNFEEIQLDKDKITIEYFIEENKDKLNNYYNVLHVLSNSYSTGHKLGRRTISKTLKNDDILLTEQEVRTILNQLRLYKMVNISKGRGGTKLTPFGFKVYKYLYGNDIIKGLNR